MKRLFTIDLKNYDKNGTKFHRPSVRGIIFNDRGELAMIYSRKFNFYKFPGGGIEENETHLDALAREIKEETGLTLMPESAKEFGEVLRLQKGDPSDIFVQYNYYYRCEVCAEIGEQDLDENEKIADFVLEFVSPEWAIATNAAFKSEDAFKKQMVEREKRVLELVSEQKQHRSR